MIFASDAIVIVTHGGMHPSYGLRSRLKRTLSTLHYNYLHRFPADVFVFYTGKRPDVNATLVKLEGDVWKTPDNTPSTRRQSGYKEGYRHMCQFYSFRLWHYLKGYTHIMRVDDDAVFCSAIQANLFDQLRESGADYGYRMVAADRNDGGIGDLVTKGNIVPYNNFFVARVGFFTKNAVKTLALLDASRRTYTHRMGDLHVHGAALCGHNATLLKYNFCYSHVTVRKGCPANGGLAGGLKNRRIFKNRHKNCTLCEIGDVVGAKDVCHLEVQC